MLQIKKFNYSNDVKLLKLKNIAFASDSKAIKDSFSYLGCIFMWNKETPHKIVAEVIPDVAYYVATIGKTKIRLVDIAIVKKYQKKGIGSFLINRLKAKAKQLKLQKISLRTSSEETAFMFYQKMGFHPIGMNGKDIEMEIILNDEMVSKS